MTAMSISAALTGFGMPWRRNRAGVRQCAEALRDIPRRMETVKRETDPLGWKIQHRPQLNLPAEYQRKLEGLRGR